MLQLLIVQVALQQRRAALQRMHVPIDQAGHQHAAVQIDRPCVRAPMNGATPASLPDVDDPAAADRERLLARCLRHRPCTRCRGGYTDVSRAPAWRRDLRRGSLRVDTRRPASAPTAAMQLD